MKSETLEPHVIDAIQAVLAQGVAIREASRTYNVPRTTLQRKINRVEAAGGLATVVDRQHHHDTKDAEDPDARKSEPSAAQVASAIAAAIASPPARCITTSTASDELTATTVTSPNKNATSSSNLTTTDAQDPNASSIRSNIPASPLYRKRSAEAMEATEAAASPPRPPSPTISDTFTSRRSKGPRKAINGKIRMLCHSAGSALDELSNELILEGKYVYKLGLGQSPFPVPQCIVDELRANAHQRDYLPVAGLPELCDDISAWGSRSLQLPFTRDDVIVGPGTKELLFVLQTVYYGDLLLPNPSCTSYAPQANIAGRNMFWLPTHAADRWVLRPEILEAHCAKDPEAPRILILNSPSNPTGCVYRDHELQAVADVARKYRMLVISDEIYSELHHDGDHHSISQFYPEGTIVSGGLSKWCGAGGWRMGFWLFPSSMAWLRKSMLVMASETFTSVAAPIQHAARRAFVPDCIELASYKQKSCKILKLISQWCFYQLQKMCVDVQPSEAGFYLFPSFAPHRKALADRGITTDVELCHSLLHDTGVAILPGSAFGRNPQELFVRLAFVDFKGDIALYLIESMDNFGMEAVDAFIQSVCPNVDVAMRRLSSWIANPPPKSTAAGSGEAASREWRSLPVVTSALLATAQLSALTGKAMSMGDGL